MASITAVEKPTVVLVHGAWHTPDCWAPVTELLKEHQYPFHTIRLPSTGGDITTTMPDDAAHIQKTTSKLVANGKEVILVMHSYGGIPGTESAKGLLKKDQQAAQKAGGIVCLVYVAAFLIPVGTSLASFLGTMAPWVEFDGDKMTAATADQIFYNDLPKARADELVSKLTHQAKPSFYTPLTYPAYQDVAVSYLLCEQDNAIPLVGQQAMAQIGGSRVTSHVCSSGHSPMLSMPSKVVDVIRGAAGEKIV